MDFVCAVERTVKKYRECDILCTLQGCLRLICACGQYIYIYLFFDSRIYGNVGIVWSVEYSLEL